MPVTFDLRKLLTQILGEEGVEVLMPKGGFGADGFPGGYWHNEPDDGLTWAEREKQDEDERFQRGEI